ncbi:HUPs like protein [Babesia gibsoni]|uniref:HUPs like protein n=1 Tax=Babesia gibsoni TaxID=33632 RepID=A0AAD8LR24_BABGI|nr:HUPs like protein [Babesia gibsoni]
MSPLGCLKLVVGGTSVLRGVEQYREKLIRCNETGLLDLSQDDASCSRDGCEESSDPLDRGSLKISNDGTTVTFRSNCLSFHLIGTKIVQLDDDAICAIYGSLHDDENLIKLRSETREDVATSLMGLRGAFTIVLASFKTNSIYILKDEIGIKSLLVSFRENEIVFSNIADDQDQQWYELPPFFITSIGHDIATIKRASLIAPQICQLQRLGYDAVTGEMVEATIDKVRTALSASIKDICSKRLVKECATILYSGGLDSALIASMVAEYVEDIQYIELVNVAFQPKRAPDRVTALCTYEDLLKLYPKVDFRLICVDVDTDEYKQMEPYLYGLIFPNTTHMDLNIAAAIHYAVTMKGYIFNPEVFKTEQWQKIRESTSIMKSVNLRVTIANTPDKQEGSNIDEGHDCTVLESIGKGKFARSSSDDDVDVLPRYWKDIQTTAMVPLVAPLGESYVSQSRDVIIGSGADELFGGYGRHAVERKKDASMAEHEINKDLIRLWKRNMGRDDRVVNQNGIAAMYPFLHDIVLETITELQVNPSTSINALVCPDWFKELGVHKSMNYQTLKNCEFLNGDSGKHISVYVNKWILREIALRIGLKHCVHFKKRAIQFGSRSAKTFNVLRGMSNRVASDKGSRVIGREDLRYHTDSFASVSHNEV